MFHDGSFASLDNVDQFLAEDMPADISGLTPVNGVQLEQQAGFELPSSVWTAMLGFYAVFFVAILAATGGSGRAIFAIVVSVLYIGMYFGLGAVIAGIKGQEKPSPLDRGQRLKTWTGPMDRKSVFGQVLIVPACVAVFGVGIAGICALILP